MTAESAAADAAAAAVELGQAYIDTNNYRRADGVLRAALSQYPDDPILLTEYARAQVLLKNYHNAAHSAYAALSRVPGDEYATRIYARALDGLGRRADALFVAWQNVIGHPGEYITHYEYARLLNLGRRPQQALIAVAEALRLNPANADNWCLRGDILRALGQSGESTAAYGATLRLAPDHAPAAHNLSLSQLDAGSYALAIDGFLGSARIDPQLGDLANRNIAAAIASVLLQTNIGVVMVAVCAMLLSAVRDVTPQWEIMLRTAVFFFALLVLASLWRLRGVPDSSWRWVFRTRKITVFHVSPTVAALLIGVAATIAGGSVWLALAAMLLLMTAVVAICSS